MSQIASSSIEQSQNPNLKLSPGLALTQAQFKKISEFMESYTGIKMPVTKQIMIQSRLQSRLKALHLSNFSEYIDYVFSSTTNASSEIVTMIDVLTTNLTHFFRESQHFDYMTGSVLPFLSNKGIKKPQLWSAGCSSGEEPYTLSIVMQEFMRKNPGKFEDFTVLATDISTRMLQKAAEAVYPLDTIEKLPLDLKKKYFLKSTDTTNPRTRLKPEVRNHIKFQRLNFMDKIYGIGDIKHIIFCRNVLIYFDKQTQWSVVSKLVDHLMPGGFLFLGHSETILGANLPLKTVAPTVFQKTKE